MNVNAFPASKLCLFALLGAADFTLTWHLLNSSAHAYESNPVAQWWLEHYGWGGLAGFKAATMAIAAALGVIIHRSHPATGHRVLAFGCLVLSAVVAYGCYLERTIHDPHEDDKVLLAESVRLRAVIEEGHEYREALSAMSEHLTAGRCQLDEAVIVLAGTTKGQCPEWRETLHLLYPELTDDEACLAANIVQYTAGIYRGRDNFLAVGCWLLEEFRARYGSELKIVGLTM